MAHKIKSASQSLTVPQRMGRSYKSLTDSVLRPVCVFLSNFGFTPNFISNFRCVLGIAGLVLYGAGFRWSGISMLIISLLLDSIDGGIARYTKTSSHRGTFIDKVADYSIYCASVIAMVYLEYVGGFAGSYHIAIVFAAVIMKIIVDNEGKKSDWVIDPTPNIVWFMIIWYASLFIFFFTAIDWMADAIFWLNVALTLTALQSYWTIHSRWSENSKKSRSR